jgi:CubicO group peptidase (beta-lactamase class C family)
MSDRGVIRGPAALPAAFYRLILAALLSLLVACGALDEGGSPASIRASGGADAAELEVGPDELAALEDFLPTLLSDAGVPGISIAVYRRGEPIWARGFGLANAETQEPITVDTVFEAASLSKPVFAYAVMRIVERGELDLDTSLAEIYPYDRLEHEPRYRQITPRMVLSHTTGLPNWGGPRLELAFDPGTEFSYSGEGFVFLQRAVEKITGMNLDELMRREVFDPLGMEYSSYVWQDEYDELSATGHDAMGRVQQKGRPRQANAAATLHTTATEYAKFLGAILEDRGLEAETLDLVLSPQVSAHGEDDELEGVVSWGLGWGLQEGIDQTSFWHWGDNGPFKAYVVGYREAGVGLVYFANGDEGLTIGEAILTSVFVDTFPSFEVLDYGRYDAPGRRARNSLRRIYVEDGGEAGLAALEDLLRDSPEITTEEFVNNLGYFLLGERRVNDAIAVLQLNRRAYPESANVYDSLGEAYLQSDRLEEAMASYRRALELDPDNEVAAPSIAWAQQSLAARQNPIQVPEETLSAYAGNYGPRRIALEEGILYYQREGNPRFRLYPVSQETFGLDGLGNFRLRFEAGGSGRIERVVGFYPDGREDASERSGR